MSVTCTRWMLLCMALPQYYGQKCKVDAVVHGTALIVFALNYFPLIGVSIRIRANHSRRLYEERWCFCCSITHNGKLVVYVVPFISRKLRKKDYKLFAACTQDTDQMNCFRFADVSECSYLYASHLFHPCFCCCFGSVCMGLGKVFCMELRKTWRILPSLVPVNRFHFTGN